MASETFYRYRGPRETFSCTVFDNGDWELFKGTKSIAHETKAIGKGGKRPLSREAMKYIATTQFDLHERQS